MNTENPPVNTIILGILCCALAGCAPLPVTDEDPIEPPTGRLVTTVPLPGANPVFETVPGLRLGR